MLLETQTLCQVRTSTTSAHEQVSAICVLCSMFSANIGLLLISLICIVYGLIVKQKFNFVD